MDHTHQNSQKIQTDRKVQESSKKSHICEDGGAHLRISFWHLLMNLKNKYLLKIC